MTLAQVRFEFQRTANPISGIDLAEKRSARHDEIFDSLCRSNRLTPRQLAEKPAELIKRLLVKILPAAKAGGAELIKSNARQYAERKSCQK